MGSAKFHQKCKGRTSTLAAFKLSEEIADWQALMSQYLVRRTRRFVIDNYAKTDDDKRSYLEFTNGNNFYFPKRTAKPIEREISVDDPAYEMASEETLDSVNALRLPRYSIGSYIHEQFMPSNKGEQDLAADLRKSAQGNLIGFTRITMFKRLSSSGPAFLATLKRHRLRNNVAAYALQNNLPLPLGSVTNTIWVDEANQEQDEQARYLGLFNNTETPAEVAYNKLRTKNPKATRWAPPTMFTTELLADLNSDTATVTEMLNRFGNWQPHKDGKLNKLTDLLTKKFSKEKVIIFTEAADTAHYVAKQLKQRGVQALEVVTGETENPTLISQRFSPNSNPVTHNTSPQPPELQILVSTDVLSEGQNLQDAHIVINYDLPWAIVRLVQRAGRVDRIGQMASEVLVYSWVPAKSVDKTIALRKRILKRLGQNARLLGSDEQFFGTSDEEKVLKNMYNEQASFGLEQIDEVEFQEVDPVSMAYEIWRHACENHPELAKQAESLPNVVYSTKHTTIDTPDSGVLVHSQTITGTDTFAFINTAGEGQRVVPQEAMRIAQCEPNTHAVTRLDNHHDLTVAALTHGGPLKVAAGSTIFALHGVRKKVWDRLHKEMDTFSDNLLFTKQDLSAAHDAINAHPLREDATHRLANALKDRTTADLAALLVDLHQKEQLSFQPSGNPENQEPTIICSQALRPPPDPEHDQNHHHDPQHLPEPESPDHA